MGRVVDELNGMTGKAQALAVLALQPGASEEDVLRAYKALAAPLKRGLTRAVSLDEKNRQRRELRRFVEARDAALGRKRETGMGSEAGAAQILDKLDGISTEHPDRDLAIRGMGLASDASDAVVLALYTDWYRALTRALGAASTDTSMRRIQHARMKMQGLRVFIFDWWDDDEDESDSDYVSDVADVTEDSQDSDKFAAAIDAESSAALRRLGGASFTSEDLAIGSAEPETDTDAFNDLKLE